MNEKERNVFLDLKWNYSAFTSEEVSVSAPLSPKQWARIISRYPERPGMEQVSLRYLPEIRYGQPECKKNN